VIGPGGKERLKGRQRSGRVGGRRRGGGVWGMFGRGVCWAAGGVESGEEVGPESGSMNLFVAAEIIFESPEPIVLVVERCGDRIMIRLALVPKTGVSCPVGRLRELMGSGIQEADMAGSLGEPMAVAVTLGLAGGGIGG